jgi:Holliday junction resolvase RusA-like endonuclease
MQIWLSGRIPSKKNSKRIVTANGRPRLLSSKEYLAWERGALLEIRDTWEDKVIIKCKSITYDFMFPCKRKRDLSNAVEGVNDTFVRAGVLKDDNWQITGDIILTGQLANNKDDAGVLVTFRGVEYE